MNANGSGVTPLTTSFAEDYAPAWSPDGSKILCETDRDSNDEIYLVNAGGSIQINVTRNSAGDRDPAW